jgi:hypothetical protein
MISERDIWMAAKAMISRYGKVTADRESGQKEAGVLPRPSCPVSS